MGFKKHPTDGAGTKDLVGYMQMRQVTINTDALDPDPVLRCMSTKSMLSGKDKALLVNLFYMNEESAIVAVRKFRIQKNVKTRKGSLTDAGLIKLVQLLEETGSPLFFETQCPVNAWKRVTINAQRYLTLLRGKVVPCLREKDTPFTATFMQDGATSHTANPVKEFLIQTFGEEKIISKRCKFPWPPRSPDLTSADV
ncbi:DUF4817 domain-containing protein [Nephila pilipes]|uniref:DUF4817 domain-containing protein n=1 Tax=Nephila pilipes TaxID=299642 RepID=A0A8X6U8W9_NEPPI|nr:DUF4817 domain-containing protein [Nephila pilipes]